MLPPFAFNPTSTAAPWAAFALLAAGALFCLPGHAQVKRVAFSDKGDFSEAALMSGISATEAQCHAAANSVWVQTKNSGSECLKYWKGGFGTQPAKRAMVYFHGDLFVGAGKTGKHYLEQTNANLQKNADSWAKYLGVPYIYFGRPGTHGSSGDHMQRRRIGESELVSAALDKLKARLGVDEWVVAGQSGGGHLTSALLTQRADIVCAVPTSAISSPRIRWEMAGRTRDMTNYTDSYEPTQFIVRDKMHPRLRVFVLGDPKDRNVYWPSQTVMADALQKAQVPVWTLQGQGAGPEAHGLSDSARIVAGWCAKDMTSKDIVARAAKGLKG